ncbi:glucokinase [Microvirga pudoricolor]|uniref:glucokinase n=1 Tax=Microvirga pudoricolor TaxID=2778729 RepID=UPI00194E3F53|nr:glucokinase [Microvirga pudoricolor]MBM6593346.1 ROK family protein [Microvirga pudoricolor]
MSPNFAFPALLGDIGGTNARFAVLPAPGEPVRLLPRRLTADTPSPVEAIQGALDTYDGAAPRSAMIAVATRVDKPVIRLTNAHWTIDARAIGEALGLERVTLVNDYTPVAASVTVLETAKGDLAPIGSTETAGPGARVVLGPGTGLGAAALVPVEDRLAILATEAGHIEFGPSGDDEFAFWHHLERTGNRVSAETVLSGPGLFRLSKALSAHRGRDCPFRLPNDVLAAAREGEPLARDTLDIFSRWLGRYAGDMALTFEASGGVFIAGGIAPRMVDVLQNGSFRGAFDRKAPHDAWACTVPAYVIINPEPALQGLAALVSDPGRFVFQSQGWSREG